MTLSNTATPKYYGRFRDAVIRGEIPVCREVAAQMNLIDNLIANPNFYYDDQAIDGFIEFCENELTLTDGEDLTTCRNVLDAGVERFAGRDRRAAFVTVDQ